MLQYQFSQIFESLYFFEYKYSFIILRYVNILLEKKGEKALHKAVTICFSNKYIKENADDEIFLAEGKLISILKETLQST